MYDQRVVDLTALINTGVSDCIETPDISLCHSFKHHVLVLAFGWYFLNISGGNVPLLAIYAMR